ncbi:helix-turn-helix transcriptional regulator [Pseudorhizobium flavum]|uniref:helix-turn-helix transcriptional regulator n=1 Tax=Pseudorhizobium flavum TaxID=1335061 RepID=UPI0024919A09|nr:AlpA family phage regulatory protein [Pseudorhizobium flavum]
MNDIPSRWLSVNDVIRLTRFSRSSINNFRADPESGFPLPIEVRGRILFLREEIDAWMAKFETAPRRQRMRQGDDRVAA